MKLVMSWRAGAAGVALSIVSTIAVAQSPLILDTQGVESALERGALIWDVRGEEDYRKGHIPGAVNIDDILMQLREARSEDYLPVSRLEQVLGDAGIDPSREMVLYGGKAAVSAYFGLVTMQWLGSDRVAVYHGGIDDWKSAGKTMATEPTRLPAIKLSLTTRQEKLVSTDEVVAKVRSGGAQIVDARTTREFSGDDIRALRGGHIPGAVNVPYEANWEDPDTLRKLARKQVNNKDGMNLKGREALEAMYAGLDRDKETIVYCQSGVRASNTAAVLQSLGFRNVRVYDSSWLGYGNALEAPAESVSYFNVGRVNSLLNALQGRVEELEAQLSELKAATKK